VYKKGSVSPAKSMPGRIVKKCSPAVREGFTSAMKPSAAEFCASTSTLQQRSVEGKEAYQRLGLPCKQTEYCGGFLLCSGSAYLLEDEEKRGRHPLSAISDASASSELLAKSATAGASSKLQTDPTGDLFQPALGEEDQDWVVQLDSSDRRAWVRGSSGWIKRDLFC
jgi:hypothetical protein